MNNQEYKIILYTKMDCPWCEEVKGFMKGKKVSFEEKEVTGNFAFFEEMKSISGQTKAPVFVCGEDILGDTDKEAVEKYLKSKKII